MALSSDSDLIVTLSRELSCRIIGAGAEKVSGTDNADLGCKLQVTRKRACG